MTTPVSGCTTGSSGPVPGAGPCDLHVYEGWC